MGASVIGYCKNMTDDLLENQPGFQNDCKAWGDWMAERENQEDVLELLSKLGFKALLTFMTDGIEEEEVDWVKPQDLSSAARKLRELVLNEDPQVTRIVETWAPGALGEISLHEEFAQDLADVANIADFFQKNGIEEMTLEVNW